MLTIFCGFRVPGVPYVDVFRDHADPQQFYVLPDRPTIARDAQTGDPLFSYSLFARNIEIAYASAGEGGVVENQLGQLMMTTDLSIPEEDMEKIRQYVTTEILENERRQESVYNKLFRAKTTATVPKIGYADTWQKGSVRLAMLEEMGVTFKRASSKESSPNLRGTLTAALWATFGTEGAQLLWDSLHPKEETTDSTPGPKNMPLQANITYELEGISRVPALHVEVHANGETVYKELRERQKVIEIANGTYWSYPQISKLTKELTDKRTIELNWEDWGIPDTDPQANDIRDRLTEMVINLVTNQIVTTFFKQFEVQGIKDEDLGMTFTHSLGGKPGSRLWLDDYTEKYTPDITLILDHSTLYRFKAFPQTSLLTSLTDEQRDRLVRVVDLGSPEVRVLTIPIATSADFETDHISHIDVTVSYKQFDTLVDEWIETGQAYRFRSEKDAFVFRTRMARNDRGQLIDLYNVKAKIFYIGAADTQPEIEFTDISDKVLTISYGRLGYINVEVQAGDIDWEEIKEVYVDFVYEPAQSEPDARGTVKLNEKTLKGKWTTSKHGQTGNRYKYAVRYIFEDGSEQTERACTSEANMLTIHDTLEGCLRRTFGVVLDPETVENVFCKVRYEDPPRPVAEENHIFKTTEDWDYKKIPRADGPQTLQYRYIIQYKDGHIEESDWKAVQPADELPTLHARRFPFVITVDGEGLDWERWRRVYIAIKYTDADHGFTDLLEPKLSAKERLVDIPILAFRADARSYEYRATFVPADGSDPVTIPTQESDFIKKTGPLLLYSPV